MNNLLWGILFALAFGALATDAEAQQLSVDEAVRQGLEHNERLRMVRAESDEARAAHRRAQAARLPSVQTSASYTRIGNVPDVEFDFPGFDTTFAFFAIPRDQIHTEVAVEQPLFAGGRLHHQALAAAGRARAARLVLEREEADVALEIRAAYWGLVQAAAVRDASEAALASVEEHLRRVEALLAEGAALRLDLLAAQTRRSEVQLELLDATSAVEVARLELNRLIGLPLTTRVELVSEHLTPESPDLGVLVQNAVERHPMLAALSEEVSARESEVAATRGAWLPEIAAAGRYVHARPNPLNILNPDAFHGHWEVGVRARWSLFDATRPATTAGARARVNTSRHRLADAEATLRVEVTRRYLEAQRAAEAFEVAVRHLAEAEEAFRVVQARFVEGAVLSAEVLEAEQVLRAAHLRGARAEADRAVAHAALLNVVGAVW